MWARLMFVILRSSDGSGGDMFLIVLLFFSLRWTCGLIKHVLTVGRTPVELVSLSVFEAFATAVKDSFYK